MSNSTQLNLDRLAAKHAQEIVCRTQEERAADVDNTVTKALGVLQEDGIYACFLYLLAKEEENGGIVVDEMLNLLDGLGFGWGKPNDTSVEEVLSHISDRVTGDKLEWLLLAKETLEQMLIYARYGAKAREG